MRSLFEQPAYDPRFVTVPSRFPAAVVFAMALPVTLVVAMLALTPLGHWQMDELLMMQAYRRNGLPSLVARIVDWSPRPFSEALLYAYSTVVHATGRQLTGTFLLLLWGLLIAACLLPASLIRTGNDEGRRIPVLIALTLLALLISGHPVAEVFYWTQAAGAYIPSIAFIAATLMCLVLVRDRSAWLDAAIAVWMSLLALSSEVGAFFAVAWGAGAPLLLRFGRWRTSQRPVVLRSDLLFVVPLVAGLAVIYMLSKARFGSAAEIYDATIARHLGPSIWQTLTTFPIDVLATDLGLPTRTGVLLGVVSKAALFAAGLLAFVRIARKTRLDLRILICALMLAALASAMFSLFAAYYQFGVNCCQRHQTIRSQLVIVAIVACAWLMAQLPVMARLRRRSSLWIALASVVAVSASAATMVVAMDADFAHYRRILQARGANWHDAMSPDPVMTLRLSHQGQVIGGIYAPVGIFEDNDSTPRPVQAMMRYFGKTKITTE